MPESELRLVKRLAEFIPQANVNNLPRRLLGIYVLYKQRISRGLIKYDVQYVGMAAAGRRGGIRGRLNSHVKRKGKFWTHFSAFEVWDNIRDEEVAELEGLFRHIYRTDSAASVLNIQRGFRKARNIRENNLKKWVGPATIRKSARKRKTRRRLKKRA